MDDAKAKLWQKLLQYNDFLVDESGCVLVRSPNDHFWDVYYVPNAVAQNLILQSKKYDALRIIDSKLSALGTHKFEYNCIEYDANPYLPRYVAKYKKMVATLPNVEISVCSENIVCKNVLEHGGMPDVIAAIRAIDQNYIFHKHVIQEKVVGYGTCFYDGGTLVNELCLITDKNYLASHFNYAVMKFFKKPHVKYFDMWNMALTERENYKKMFFTKPSFRNCNYIGPIRDSWLQQVD
jgi:hypothetical protein